MRKDIGAENRRYNLEMIEKEIKDRLGVAKQKGLIERLNLNLRFCLELKNTNKIEDLKQFTKSNQLKQKHLVIKELNIQNKINFRDSSKFLETETSKLPTNKKTIKLLSCL